MSSESKAREAVNTLVLERDTERARAEAYKADAMRLSREVRELESQLYGRMARTLSRSYDIEREFKPALNAHCFRITPKCAAFMLSRDAVLNARYPFGVVEKYIEEVAQRVSDDIRDQLRKVAREVV